MASGADPVQAPERTRRAVLAWGMAILGLASAASVIIAAGADALLLEQVSATGFGLAVAVSSALLAVVLVGVGSLADRVAPARLLLALAAAAALVVGAVDGVVQVAPVPGAVLAMVIGKQLSAAVDLTIWVVLARRLDARQLARGTTALLTAGALGAAAGAGVVVVVAPRVGASGLLLGGACLLAVIAVMALRVPGRAVVTAPSLAPSSWSQSTRAALRSPLVARLAVVVAIAGAFSALAYVAISGVAARAHGGADGLPQFLGAMRGAAIVLSLLVQLTLGPWLLRQFGAALGLIGPPLLALASAAVMLVAPGLATALVMHAQGKVLDVALQGPAEKLVLAVAPLELRGRIGGFLDGVAKRGGAVIGGVAAIALAGAPSALMVVLVVLGAAWLAGAARLARDLPALASGVVDGATGDAGAPAGDVHVATLVPMLARPGDASSALALDAALVGLTPALASAPPQPLPLEVLGAARREPDEARAAALWRVVGLGAPPAGALEATADTVLPPIVELARATAFARWRDDRDEELALADDALRADVALADAGLRELALGVRRATAVGEQPWRAVRTLERAVRRGRGEVGGRAEAMRALAAVLRAHPTLASAEHALMRSALGELAAARVGATSGTAPLERAAAVALLAAACATGGAGGDDGLRQVALALGDRDDEVRASAGAAIRDLGAAMVPALLHVAAWGPRAARDHAARLLGERTVAAEAIDRLLERELAALAAADRRVPALLRVGGPDLPRRLRERRHELVQGVLQLVASRQRSPALAAAARRHRLATSDDARGRALAIADAALPRDLRRRVMPVLDGAPGEDVGDPEQAVAAELAALDGVGRALLLDGLSAGGRRELRDEIAAAAGRVARAEASASLVTRLAMSDAAIDSAAVEMPSPVELIGHLARVPMLADASSRQLVQLAERARWVPTAAGDVLAAAGEVLADLLIVVDGELVGGTRRWRAGEVVDELAMIDPRPSPHELRVTQAGHLVRLTGADFVELLDEVPGLSPAVCRALGGRLRARP